MAQRVEGRCLYSEVQRVSCHLQQDEGDGRKVWTREGGQSWAEERKTDPSCKAIEPEEHTH